MVNILHHLNYFSDHFEDNTFLEDGIFSLCTAIVIMRIYCGYLCRSWEQYLMEKLKAALLLTVQIGSKTYVCFVGATIDQKTHPIMLQLLHRRNCNRHADLLKNGR